MANLIEKIKLLFQQRKETINKENIGQTPPDSSANPAVQSIDAEIVRNLMVMLDHTHEGMYNCEETFSLLDEYVELVVNDSEEAATLMPYVKRHLEKCPGCFEEYETLRRVLETEPAAE